MAGLAAALAASALAAYSDSEDEKEKEAHKEEEPAPVEEESDSESSSSDGGGKRRKLTSAANAFSNVTEGDLGFKRFAKIEKMKRIAKEAEEDLTWRVTAASSDTLSSIGGSLPAVANNGTQQEGGDAPSPPKMPQKLGQTASTVTPDSLSTLGGETNMTKLYSLHPGVQQKAERAALGAQGRLDYALTMQRQGHSADRMEKNELKTNAKEGMSTKDRTKLKRAKGQSGEDHNGRVWKPQIMMDMRANYD